MTAPAAPTRFASWAVETSAGEIEHDRWSRRANAVEALLVWLLMFVAFQTGIAGPPRSNETWMRGLGLALAVLTGFYVIVFAPRVHGDDWHARGLSAPFELGALWPGLRGGFRLTAAALSAVLPAFIAWVGWDALLVRLGVRAAWPAAYERLSDAPWHAAGAVFAAAAMGAALAALLIRWDNLATAARALMWPVGAALAGIVGAAACVAVVSGDWTRITGFTWLGGPRAFLPRLAAYAPWGLLQQWFFLSYLNTRVRRAVPAAGAFGLSGRAIAAGLAGVAFGAIHWPNMPLMLLTLVSGCISGWVFQRDRSRNLFLLGFAHAAAGALVTALTGVRMDVGPRL